MLRLRIGDSHGVLPEIVGVGQEPSLQRRHLVWRRIGPAGVVANEAARLC
jgi:hypothetical protein